MSVGILEVSHGPTLSEVFGFQDTIEESTGCYIGDKLKFTHLKEDYGFEVVDITVVEMPTNANKYGNKDYNCFKSKAVIRLKADCSMYNLDSSSIPNSTMLTENLKNWVGLGSKEEEGLAKDGRRAIYLCDGYEVSDKPSVHGKKEINVGVFFLPYKLVKTENVISSPFYDDFLDPCMNAIIKEGVCYSNKKVPTDLRDSLRKNLDKLAAETPVDYHPNSNNIVRDLVHPALYAYVDGVSKFRQGKSKISINEMVKEKTTDIWGRIYERSVYQWLPTPFHISRDGKCTIKEYINNLDREKNQDLYLDLEKLFELFLPYFQEVWSYAKDLDFWCMRSDGYDSLSDERPREFVKSPIDFNGKELQIITKIVEYKLQPDQAYEGVWHVEGMSHENIIMTGNSQLFSKRSYLILYI